MKIIDNPTLIKRNKFFTQATLIGSLAILGLGFFLSITNNSATNFFLSLTALVVGYILARVNINLTTLWGGSPRQDEQIALSLKGLGDKFHLFQYQTPTPHLLIGPCGIWVLTPVDVSGDVSYHSETNLWTHRKVGGLFSRIFSTEKLGDPIQKNRNEVKKVKRFLDNLHHNTALNSEIEGVIVFLNHNTNLDVKESPIPAIGIEKLKEFIRKKVVLGPDNLIYLQDLATLLEDRLG